MKLILGDCLERMKELEADSVDAIVTDPPYFLTNSSGSGFMGKEWDSLSVANAFAEAVLGSLRPVWLTDEGNSAQESASTNIKSRKKGKSIHALYAQPNSIEQNRSLSLGTFSVLDRVLTKAEVLALSRELSPSLTSAIEKQPDHVLYVAANSFTAKCPRSIAQELALKLDTPSLCEEIETLRSLMGDQKTSGHIEATTGRKSDSGFTQGTSSSAESVESIVLEKRYSVTTSSHIESQKIIRWITSLRFVRNAMATFTANPSNIQVLSERFHYRWAAEAIRVLKPGGHVLAFAGTRTYHPLANAIQSAGFEIRDQLQYLYGQGFPKSHNGPWGGTALKPANEPIVLARKPLIGTVAKNFEKYGTGGLNIDGPRIESANNEHFRSTVRKAEGSQKVTYEGQAYKNEFEPTNSPLGRYPANVILDEEAAKMLDEQTGELKSGSGKKNTRNSRGNTYGVPGPANNTVFNSDSGGASRFFYVAKASKRDRNAGLEGMPSKVISVWGGDDDDLSEGKKSTIPRQNHHPTVKPTKLMEYLVRLITPPGGTVLDPFMGSGSTGVACARLGFDFIGIELNQEYLDIAQRRIEFEQVWPGPDEDGDQLDLEGEATA